MWGSKWLVKVSTQRRTGVAGWGLGVGAGAPASGSAIRALALPAKPCTNVLEANLGMVRFWATPPTAFTSVLNPGACVTKFARRGAREARPAQAWIRPSV